MRGTFGVGLACGLGLLLAACGAVAAPAATADTGGRLDHAALATALARLGDETPGSLGACVVDSGGIACVNGDTRYSLQSVMKLLVALAAFDAADRGELDLSETVTVRRENLSLYVQPIAKLVGEDGYTTTWRDLARRAVVDSDSAATDILVDRLGGADRIQAILDRKGLTGVRIDRDERRLQTETLGLVWRPEFVDEDVLDQAIAAVPPAVKAAAQARYLTDVRDTATPRGMATLLHRLARGELLSPGSTEGLLAIMRETRTFPGRLRAGAKPGWTVGHKTGSSGAHEGLTTVTNDVGLYWPPDGPPIAIAVFLGRSPLDLEGRNAAIAAVGKAASTSWRDE